MSTPQIAASAPDKDCPKCGRRMQHLSSSATTHSYVCYGHTLQNSDSAEPFYLNVHYKLKLGPDGKLLTKDGTAAVDIPETKAGGRR